MSPSDIEVLIHYHCCPAVHPRDDAPAVQEATQEFLMDGIIMHDAKSKSGYRTTERGRALLAAICATPLPTEAWVDDNGKVIIFN